MPGVIKQNKALVLDKDVIQRVGPAGEMQRAGK